MGDRFSSIDSMKDVDVLVNMCPGVNDIKFYLPDFGKNFRNVLVMDN